jgi:hypothetical protein
MVFVGVISLIKPLSIVSQEERNSPSVRHWAVDRLRQINSSTGIRQAGLLADTVSQSMISIPVMKCMVGKGLDTL